MNQETVEKARRLEQSALDLKDEVDDLKAKLTRSMVKIIKDNLKQYDVETLDLIRQATTELKLERRGWKLKDV